jgi:hypothetical protein
MVLKKFSFIFAHSNKPEAIDRQSSLCSAVGSCEMNFPAQIFGYISFAHPKRNSLLFSYFPDGY